ncbi:hypothetical protein OAJ04_01720 [Candidatus Nitrosopelagicus sp.]|nr:hypothetical protein [Candidatus Nitrosopelagicus sp.]
MKWRSSTKKEGSSNSRRETLESYEQKYLEKFNKVKSEIQKIQEKQKDVEVKELKDRIARRLKLEKETGKKYKKIISKPLKSETKVEAEIETNAKAETERKIEAEIETNAEILADVKSTIQKRMSNVFKGFRETQSKPSTVAEDTRNFVRKRRTERVETIEEIHEEKIQNDESVNKQIKKEEERERIKADKFLKEAEEKDKAEAKEKAEAEKALKEDIKKKRDDEKEKNKRLLIEDDEKEKNKVSKPKKGKLKTEKDIESKIAKLEKKLQKEEKASSNFIKSTLDTAVSEGWTKTKTVEELRKSKEKITIKKAKELVSEAFDAKTKKN